MSFDEAEAKFRQLYSRRQNGEPIGQAEFEEQVRQLAVRDDDGVWWGIHPHTGQWMYFDGKEWRSGNPPGRANSEPLPGSASPPAKSRAASPTSSVSRSSSSTSTEPTYVRAVGAKQLQSRLPLRLPEQGERSRWLTLAGGAVLVFVCLVLAIWGASSGLQALSQAPVLTRTPIVSPTATPAPTIVRLPTQPVVAATPVAVLAQVIEALVNVRAAPGLNAQIVTTIKKDDRITLVGRSRDGQWYQIVYRPDAKPAWVFAETLQIVNGSPQTLPVVNP